MFLTKFQCDEKGPSFTHKFNFAAFWHGVKNVEEPSLCPASALPPPSFLLSIGSAQLVKQTKKSLCDSLAKEGVLPLEVKSAMCMQA